MQPWYRRLQLWWRPLALILVLIGVGTTAHFWLPWIDPAWKLLDDNSGSIEGLAGIITILSTLGAVLVFIFGVVRPAQQHADGSVRDQKTDLTPVLQQYLNVIAERHRYFDARGLGVSGVTVKLALLELYVPLKARLDVPEGETAARGLTLAGRPLAHSLAAEGSARLSEPQPLADLLQNNASLIILGDPGAGKSTFLRYLALTTALGQAAKLGLHGRIPFLLPLSAYANRLAEADLSLEACIVDYYRSGGFADELAIGPLLDDALRTGKALLLLDGLDEVRQASRRMQVVDRVCDFFLVQRRFGNQFILTSRLVGYKEVRRPVDGLTECTLTDFDDAEIEQFVTQWTAAIERTAQGDTGSAAYNARRERDELLAEIKRNAGVRRLAANPLLLTVLALMKRKDIRLPEQRAELYHTYVKTLLENWQRARTLDRTPVREINARATLQVLAPLARWMHEVSPGVGLVRQAELERRVEELCRQQQAGDPVALAEQFMHDVHRERSLLVERGGDQINMAFCTPPCKSIWWRWRWYRRPRRALSQWCKRWPSTWTTPTGMRSAC
jgi:hypothetical protein